MRNLAMKNSCHIAQLGRVCYQQCDHSHTLVSTLELLMILQKSSSMVLKDFDKTAVLLFCIISYFGLQQ